MPRIKPEDAERGALAEAAFRQWLDASRLPYIYATQTQESLPIHFRGALKRPDYLVALPFVGTLAFDVKSKNLYGGAYLFDVSEVERLDRFGDLFKIAVFFACLDPQGGPDSRWFRVETLRDHPRKKLRGRAVHVVPLSYGLAVNMQLSFQEALRNAISLA
ncbi:hypothetical protein CCR97_00370 [Rhodoplanes elegans]|uniref:Uncharacterized protein n=1 Tax=Rhodoplanes elegans TaxID=29408 RepID=A0A327KNN7_9BRAD|nr:hypothetical protein [Rhodoplanes elegans]MBK5956692.1 hypothetical protein [Rhodoplanes elegans]RAI39203.1 hypothetical protein CH338_10255 [Rhodoplanes elegans]